MRVQVSVSGRHMRGCQKWDFDETAVGNGRRAMRQWVTHHFVLPCTPGCACVLVCVCVLHWPCYLQLKWKSPGAPEKSLANTCISQNSLCRFGSRYKVWHSLPHQSSLLSLSLLVLGMLLWFSIRPPILTSGGLDKQETHWAHQLIGQTKGRLKPIIYLIYNEVNQSDHKGRHQHNHSERRTTQCGAHLSWSEKGTLKVSCTFCSWWKTEDYSVQVWI